MIAPPITRVGMYLTQSDNLASQNTSMLWRVRHMLRRPSIFMPDELPAQVRTTKKAQNCCYNNLLYFWVQDV